MRKIIHIDMDAFYASVEQRDNPELRGKPIAVGSDSDRGVITTASYEARKFGVGSAMPSKIAIRKCPNLIFVMPRFEAYKAVSQEIREIFYTYTNLVEPLSLDEAYLDVTINKKSIPSATLIAREIKSMIFQKTKLTASAGISFNKFLAKTASDVNKPDGIFLISPEQAVAYVENLAIEKFFGIGKVTAQKMHDMGIYTGMDLKKWPELDLINRFGKAGKFYYQIARAEDSREVNPDRVRKSIGAENTFEKDLLEYSEILQELSEISAILSKRMLRSNSQGKTITLKVKYNDFQQITRSKTLPFWISTNEHMSQIIPELLESFEIRAGIRLLGLTISNLNKELKHSDEKNMQLTIDF